MEDNLEQANVEAWTDPVGEAPEAPADLKDVTKQAADYKEEIDAMEVKLKSIKEKYKRVSDTILRTLDLMELENVRAHGFLFYRETKSSVVTPKTPEEKKMLFDFLQEKGVFLEIASVNSQTLNSLYKTFAAEAADKGNFDFKMPGVPEPTSYTSLKLRRG